VLTVYFRSTSGIISGPTIGIRAGTNIWYQSEVLQGGPYQQILKTDAYIILQL